MLKTVDSFSLLGNELLSALYMIIEINEIDRKAGLKYIIFMKLMHSSCHFTTGISGNYASRIR